MKVKLYLIFSYSPKNELYLQKSHNNTSLKIFHNMITKVFVMPLKDPPCKQSWIHAPLFFFFSYPIIRFNAGVLKGVIAAQR